MKMTNAQRDITKMASFIAWHGNHGEVTVTLDVVPDVIRFDCGSHDCSLNLQIKYERSWEKK